LEGVLPAAILLDGGRCSAAFSTTAAMLGRARDEDCVAGARDLGDPGGRSNTLGIGPNTVLVWRYAAGMFVSYQFLAVIPVDRFSYAVSRL